MKLFTQHHTSRRSQRGAVSLFIVIFAAMLMTILTVSFVRLMVHDQMQATNNDLSQSAHDTALAGVEDAKRALVACQNGDAAICGIIDSKQCTTLSDAGIVPSSSTAGNKDMPVQTILGDDTAKQLDQAYTCVTISRTTDDYIGQLKVGESKIVPLKGVSKFDTVELSWFQYEDFQAARPSANQALSYFTAAAPYKLPSMSSNRWPKNSPPLLRTQLMQYATDAGFTFADLDNGADANATFLYPLGAATPNNPTYPLAAAGRGQQTSPHPVFCQRQLAAGGYACTVKLQLPNPAQGSSDNRVAYLRLTSLYNPTHYSVKLFNGSSLVQINGEQPIVDSTARANNVFRRVEGRVEMASDFPYPNSAVDITGSLCKNFVVTDDANVAETSNVCTP